MIGDTQLEHWGDQYVAVDGSGPARMKTMLKLVDHRTDLDGLELLGPRKS